MSAAALLDQLGQAAIAATPSTLLAIAALGVSIVLFRRRPIVGVLAAAGAALVLLGNVLVLAAGPLGTLLVGLTFSGRMSADRLGLVTTAYSAFGSVVAAISMALLVAMALVAMRGRAQPKALPHRVHGERFVVGLAYTSVATVLVAIVMVGLGAFTGVHALGLTGGSAHPTPTATPSGCAPTVPNPSPPIDPGTYTAGPLHAPTTLHGECRSEPSSARDVQDAKKARDDFSNGLGGKPAIFANYGALTNLLQLYAGQGYETPQQYFDGSQGTYTTIGAVTCDTLGATICIRSDEAQQLTVVVSGFANPAATASAVDEAWRAEGGH